MSIARRISQTVADLWNGRIAMSRVFWEYAIAYGTVLHLVTTLAAFAAFAKDWPALIGFTIFFLPAPYTLLMIVAVWKSAARYAGPAIWSTLARALIIVWAAFATLL